MSFNEDWQEVKFGEIIESVSKTHSFDKDEIILINTSDVLDGKVLNHKYVKNENIKGQFKKTFKKNDILYSEIRPKNKRFAYVDFNAKDYVASTKLMVLRKTVNEVENRFLFYVITSNKIINKLQNLAETRSGTFPQITFNEVANLKIKIPTFREQRKIANFISSIDEKIENNNKMNKTLEEMAQAIYKSWFVDFEPFQDEKFVESELGLIPKNWEVVSFDDLFEFQKGKTPKNKSKEKKEGYLKYLTISVLSGKKTVYGKPTEKNILVNENDVVMVMDGSRSGKIFFGTSGIVASTLAKLNIINDNISNGFIYLLAKYYEKEFMKNTTGSAVPHADKKYILNKKIAIPKNKNLLSNFNKSINDIKTKISLNREENHSLKELRDSLLPKLMSGEIRVPIDEDAKEVN